MDPPASNQSVPPTLAPQHSKKPVQVSLSFLLLLMLVFSIISAGLLYASRVPAVQDEISALTNQSADASPDEGNFSHLVFIMFTFTSPLILAGILSTSLAVLRWVRNAR